MRTKLRRFWPHMILFGLALALRCYGLGLPLLDYHSWRQADTAAMARNFIASGYQFQAPQVDWGGQKPGYVESEFPLYSGALALLWGLFGPHVWIGRLLSALASAATCAVLYSLARPISGRRAALYAGVTLALLPFALYFGRTVMPDAWMLLGALLALLTFQRWLDQPSVGRFRLALIFGALAPLAKTPNLVIVGVPLAYLAWPLLAVRPARKAVLIYAACFALPALLWTAHARTLPIDPRLSFGIGEKLFDMRLLIDPHFYLLIARWSIENVLTWAGLPLFLLGLFTRQGGKEARRQGDKSPQQSAFLLVSS
ncbi:MAG TPA: glycosyltransferase family 39 protein, partial [Roseiflexaceae bacterium]|nr:glycosyltransferase family 39 protein [Roseiflexaceae bacterium]